MRDMAECKFEDEMMFVCKVMRDDSFQLQVPGLIQLLCNIYEIEFLETRQPETLIHKWDSSGTFGEITQIENYRPPSAYSTVREVYIIADCG